ncbi:UDP-N-acetylmuramoyl-tripeptide--D-alanyl-D-alanine ligase [Weeksellaceae bacterium TAE3-ERU29]|nr:UDP-N-acetylmuramoyl-tripeptide--D-alanyl-D-alanine ligase [Weeksellaceae bacterium TAE3-ERU29]
MNIKDFYKEYKNQLSICTDTRKLKKNDIFVALKGDNFNGNEYAKQAIENGAIVAIVDEDKYKDESNNIYLVENSLTFLQKLANYHRNQLDIKIISLTGSNGKTTTKELIANCLMKKYKIAFTKGNLNNHIGVPLTLLSINKYHELAVVEMGANHPNEIKELCKIANPDYGYITNFGKAHLEGFGSAEGVVKAKSELYDYLRKSKGTAFINNDDNKQIQQSEGIQKITFAFENKGDYNFSRILREGKAGVSFNNVTIQSNLVGNYNQNNIAVAVSIALHFGIDINEIKDAVENYIPKINRSQIVEKNGRTIIMDAYNANPSSMEVALKHFSYYDGTKAVLLGDMFELGKYSEEEHCKVLSLVKDLNFNEIYLLGDNFYNCAKKQDEHLHAFRNREDFQEFIINHPISSQSILVKGSRGMQLEKINLD